MHFSPRVSRRTVLAGLAASCAARHDLLGTALAGVKPASPAQAVHAANSLGGKVLAELASSNENVILSPFSLYSALSLLTLGAESEARKSLRAKGLLSGATIAEALQAQAALAEILKRAAEDKIQLTAANSVWVRDGARVNPFYVRDATAAFSADVHNIDFHTSAAAEKINAWTKGKTKGAIPTIVDRLDPQTEFVLANALHFKGAWARPFDPAQSKPAPFMLADGSKHDVPMMNGTVIGGYWRGKKLHAASLLYTGDSLVMIIVMPVPGKSPQPLAKALGTETLDQVLDRARFEVKPLKVKLPRFKFEHTSELEQPLSARGLKQLFDPKTRFSGITGVPISRPEVFHRAMIDVNEAGTEAAAATAVTGTRSAAPLPPQEFVVDRPFLVSISDVKSKLDLFHGMITNPVA